MGKRIGKRIGLITAVLSLLIGIMIGSTAYAATIKQPYLAEQANAKAPDVKVYMTGAKMSSSAAVSGEIDGNALTQNGDITSFEKSGEGLHYIILIDNSGSIDSKQFNEVKKQLVSMRKSLGKKDKMTLYSVGTTSAGGTKKNVLGRTALGSEKSKKSSDISKIKKIKYMATKKSKTVLYRSLNEVLAAESSPGMRTVVLLLTDGEDDSKGKDIDKKSTSNEVKNAMVPVYGILLHNVSKSPNKKKMSYTTNKILAEKNCRGYYYDCSTSSSVSKVKKAFSVIDNLIRKKTYVVNLKAGTNKTAGKTDLKLTVDNTGIDSVKVDYSDYEKDGDEPVIAGSVEKISNNSIRFSLQDANGVNTEDAQEASHYVVQTKQEDGNGKIWTVNAVNIQTAGDELSVTLTLAEDLYTDTYILKCNNIRDNSQDENVMNASSEFNVEDGLNKQAVQRKEIIREYWWIGLIVLVVILGVVIMIIVRRRPGKIVEVNPDELVKADTKQIRLTITDRSGAIKDVEWKVEGSLFVGRSEICNIYFDDDRLSKQHFVIEVTKMGCYIEDLESTNGTFVNGVKMTNRRMLLDGDVITAGREKIVFHVPKNVSLADDSEEIE